MELQGKYLKIRIVKINGKEMPLYMQLIHQVRKGMSFLDEKSQLEVRNFIKKSQHKSGGFIDRAGNPDLYYSLFGVWISEALGQKDLFNRYRMFFEEKNEKPGQATDFFSSLLIRRLMETGASYRPPLFVLIKAFLNRKSHLNIFYRLFFLFITYDAFYSKNALRHFIRITLLLYTPPELSPCSVRAAYLLGRSLTGLSTGKEKKKLFSFHEEGKGFKAFPEMERTDLLSTAVALFALKSAGADLRIVAPGCLDLIQRSYREGAFVAGNGDEACDLEYTFYGLLALGSLHSL